MRTAKDAKKAELALAAQSLAEVLCSIAVFATHVPGISRFGIGDAANSFWQGLASQRAHCAERDTRALSVEQSVATILEWVARNPTHP